MKIRINKLIDEINISNNAALQERKQLPEYLYKYRGSTSSHAIASLREDRLKLSIPLDLNDPTECLLYVNPDRIKDFFFDNTNGLPDCVDNHIAERNDETDYSKWNSAYFSNAALDSINYLQNKTGIISLSEANDSPLMWAHYAENHTGFAIRYRTQGLFSDRDCDKCKALCYRKERPIYPVNYADVRFDATNYAILYSLHKELGTKFKKYCGFAFEEMVEPIASVIQKSKDWEYEKEWRIVCKDPCKEFYSMKADAVIIGARATLGMWKELIAVVREKSLKTYAEEIDYYNDKYHVNICEMSDAEVDAIINLGFDDDTIIMR